MTDKRGLKKGWWPGDKIWRWRGRMGLWGGSLCLVYPAGRDPDRALMSPTIPYPPSSPTSCPCCSDVTDQLGMSRPHPPMLAVCPLLPLSQLSFNRWSPTVTWDSQRSTYQTQTGRQACRHTVESMHKHIQYLALNGANINH